MIGCLVLVISVQLSKAYPSTMTLPTYSTPPAWIGTLDHIDLRTDIQIIIRMDHCCLTSMRSEEEPSVTACLRT